MSVKLLKKELILLALLILVGVLIRSLHFQEYLNFSSDQATSSMKSLEIWKNKEITLVGIPITSYQYQGRQLFIGSTTYYFQLIFLLVGKFDPLISSYIFSIFSCLMMLPLFIGTKMLIDKRSGYILTILYALLPLYKNYTSFLWNPNFQFSLSPLLVLSMGLYQKYQSKKFIILTGLLMGLLLTFHYQFIVVVIGVIIYYIYKREKKSFFCLLS